MSAAVVVTGLSGAGKTTALNALADLGYYCVDNLPPTLAAATVRACTAAGIERVALGMDVRVGSFLDVLDDAIDGLRHHPAGLTVLYLDAAVDALVRRFSETRRPHPIIAALSKEEKPASLQDAVELEQRRLASIRSLATHVIDTSLLSVHELRRMVVERFGRDDAPRMQLRVMSFGYKHGMPLDANLVFDVRFLDNPYFVPELRDKTGNDKEVSDFVLASDAAEDLVSRLDDTLQWSLPLYRREGKSYFTVAIGCTGGRHRSVAISNELAERMSAAMGQRVGIVHRDVARGAMMTGVSRTRWSEPNLPATEEQ